MGTRRPDAHLISSMMAFIALGLMFSFVLAACIVAPGRTPAPTQPQPQSVLACTLESVEARAWLAPYLRQRESSCTSRCGAVARRAAGAVSPRTDAPVVAEPSHRVEQVPSPAELAAQPSRLSCCTRARLAPAERQCCAGQRGRAALRSRPEPGRVGGGAVEWWLTSGRDV